MASSYYAGLPVTSHTSPTQVLNTSTFDHVSPTNTLPAAPTGLAATAQAQRGKIKLTWTQSTSPNITNNKVYRSTTSGGPYTLVTSIAAATTYTDTGLTSGTTYYYVVTAVDSNGVESPYSNQASAKSK
jgi:cellulose 1,4-beta-cellobiosidase